MPRPLGFRIRAVADLHRQLAYAPEDARLRQMAAAERLIDELDPAGMIAATEVVRRITGYRPESATEGDDLIFVGEALRADLAVFVQKLSETLDLDPDDRQGGAETVEALAARLSVSVRTIQRWRRLGLTLHWMTFRDGQRRLGCYVEALAAYRRRVPVEAAPRRGKRQLDAPRRTAIVNDARERAARTGEGVSAVSEAIAKAHERSPDAVRRLLLRHDRDAVDPIFVAKPTTSSKLRRLVDRAWRWGISPARMAQRWGRGEPAIHRQLMLARRDRLLASSPEWVELPTFSIRDAESIILSAPAAVTDLSRLVPALDAHRTLEAIRARPEVDDDRQEARLAASGLLRRRAAQRLLKFSRGPVPGAAAIDAVESDLRWSLLLLLTAIADELPGVIRRGEGVAGRAAERLSGESLLGLITLGIRVAAETLPMLDPTRRQRPSRRLALEMDKAIARRDWAERRNRAVAVVPAAAEIAADPCAGLWPWQSVVDLPPAWFRAIESLPPRHRAALRLRHGLDGAPPRNLAQIAVEMSVNASHAARLVREAELRLRWDRRDRDDSTSTRTARG